jgi:hypothetical protein
MATADNVTAAQDSVATILASQKMEELRTPVLPGALGVSPAGTLETSVPGFVDHVGADGLVVGTASTPPGTAVFTRRWAIEPLPAAGAGAVLVRVIVMPSRRGGPRRPAWGGGQPGTSRVASILDRAVP